MKKQLFILMLVISLLSSSCAMAWQCVGCDHEITDAYCSHCGKKAVANASDYAFENTAHMTQSAAGTIRWSKKQTPAPYQVLYIQKTKNTIQEELATVNQSNILWDGGQLEGNYGWYEIEALADETDYWILLQDQDGNRVYTLCQSTAATAFAKTNVPFEMTFVKKATDGSMTPLNAVSAAQVFNNPNTYYLRLTLFDVYELSDASGLLLCSSRIVLDIPENNLRFTLRSSELDSFPKNKDTTYSLSLDHIFSVLNRRFGKIPSGTYRITVYIGGEKALSTSFKMDGYVAPTPKPTAKPTNKCRTCGGDGRVERSCIPCGGDGKSNCYICGGDGKDMCFACSGRGYLRSGQDCSCNNGYKRCGTCSGTGDRRCTECGGDGKVSRSCPDCQ